MPKTGLTLFVFLTAVSNDLMRSYLRFHHHIDRESVHCLDGQCVQHSSLWCQAERTCTRTRGEAHQPVSLQQRDEGGCNVDVSDAVGVAEFPAVLQRRRNDGVAEDAG